MKVLIHPDSWVCLCGSSRGFNTFVPCTVDGIPIPYRCQDCMQRPKFYRCSHCGRVVRADTMEVVSSTLSLGLHWLGRRWLPQWSWRDRRGCQHV